MGRTCSTHKNGGEDQHLEGTTSKPVRYTAGGQINLLLSIPTGSRAQPTSFSTGAESQAEPLPSSSVGSQAKCGPHLFMFNHFTIYIMSNPILVKMCSLQYS